MFLRFVNRAMTRKLYFYSYSSSLASRRGALYVQSAYIYYPLRSFTQQVSSDKKKNNLATPPLPADLQGSLPPLSIKPIKNDDTNVKAGLVPKPEEAKALAEVKPSLWQRFKAEMIHYYHGFRLLGLDIKIASGLCFQVLTGKTLTRRERNQLVRTVADIFRLVPFAVFVIVPFMEFLLPVYIKLFPFMLPSTFKEQKSEDEKIKLRLKAKLEMAKFLQDTLSQTSQTAVKTASDNPTLEQFSQFLTEIRNTGQVPQIQDIVKFSGLFEDQITLDSLDQKNLKALCQLLDISTMGPANLLRLKLYMRVRQLKAQDQMIANEGIDQIPPFELQSLSRERGMRSIGMSEDRLRHQLTQWLELHLNHKVPIALLLLSRAMYMHDRSPAQQLQMAISELPNSVAHEAELKVAETRPQPTKTKIELLRREQETIKKERREISEAEKKAKSEVLVDKAPVVETPGAPVDTVKVFKPSASIVGPESMSEVRAEDMLKELAGSDTVQLAEVEKQLREALTADAAATTTISFDDLGTISKAISELETSKQAMHEEEVQDLKDSIMEATKKQEKQQAELQEALVASQSTEEIKQNKVARQLATRVDKMLGEMGTIIGNLGKEKTTLLKDIELQQVMAKHENEQEERSRIERSIEAGKNRMIEVNELLIALKKIQKVPDDTKWQRILEVLDEDKDGKIELKHVLSVIELMGSDNMKLDSKEMTRILDMLDNEEILENKPPAVTNSDQQKNP